MTTKEMTFGGLLALALRDDMNPAAEYLESDLYSRTPHGAELRLSTESFAVIGSDDVAGTDVRGVSGRLDWPRRARDGSPRPFDGVRGGGDAREGPGRDTSGRHHASGERDGGRGRGPRYRRPGVSLCKRDRGQEQLQQPASPTGGLRLERVGRDRGLPSGGHQASAISAACER